MFPQVRVLLWVGCHWRAAHVECAAMVGTGEGKSAAGRFSTVHGDDAVICGKGPNTEVS